MLNSSSRNRLQSPPLWLKSLRLTDDGDVLRPVQGADDDEAEAFVLLAVNDHIAGVHGGALRQRGDSGAAGRCWCRGGVAAWRAVLRGHRAGAAAVHWTEFTWRKRAHCLKSKKTNTTQRWLHDKQTKDDLQPQKRCGRDVHGDPVGTLVSLNAMPVNCAACSPILIERGWNDPNHTEQKEPRTNTRPHQACAPSSSQSSWLDRCERPRASSRLRICAVSQQPHFYPPKSARPRVEGARRAQRGCSLL